MYQNDGFISFENSIDSVNEIDQLVYQLYNLTPEEIQIVENSIKWTKEKTLIIDNWKLIMKENGIKIKSFDFALRIVKLYQYLQIEKKEFVLSKQLLRSAPPLVP